MQSVNSKLTFQHPSWQELELHLDNLRVVSSLIQTTHSEVSSRLTWLSENMLPKEQVSGLTQEEYEALGQRLEVVKFNIQELSHSLKSLSQLLDVALKMVSEVEVQLSTFQYGTKKSKTSLSSKITKALKITELGN